MNPVTNTISRTMEFEADMYGLNAARQPDGEAKVDMMLGEYRKLDPGPVEEIFFLIIRADAPTSPPPCAGRRSTRSRRPRRARQASSIRLKTSSRSEGWSSQLDGAGFYGVVQALAQVRP
jgi:hypothetical protein